MLVLCSISDSVEEGENGLGWTKVVQHGPLWTLSSVAEALVTGNKRFFKPWITKKGRHRLLFPSSLHQSTKQMLSVCLFRLWTHWPVSSCPYWTSPSWTIHMHYWTFTLLALNVCPALNMSSVLTQHSSVLPSKWPQCPGSLLEASFSSWIWLNMRLGFLGPSGLIPRQLGY